MAIGYKLFRTKNGKLYPLYVLANKETPVGKWIEAECGEMSENGKVKSRLGESLSCRMASERWSSVCISYLFRT